MRHLILVAGIAIAGLILLKNANTQGNSISDPGPPDDAWFASNVVNVEVPVLVKFGAQWCGPCRRMEPELDKIEQSLAGKLAVVRIDTEEYPELAEHYGVSGIPHIFLMHRGKLIADRVGYHSADEINDLYDDNF